MTSPFESRYPNEKQIYNRANIPSQSSISADYVPSSERMLVPDAPSGYQSQANMGEVKIPITARDKNVATTFALLFGAWGLHLFYLKYYKQGAIMVTISTILTICTIGIGLSIPAMYGIAIGLRYLSKNKKAWYSRYVLDRSNPWW